ncbi:uncharacterized protein G2W53_027285 [Senna tora]|uniref:Uncharacterized protein n=1 Tax=Senna tora TaxID=362788 RepID=A0A834TJ29_9FABA|nr:uncharacterized protein G2W53_027285 [Senna tora]
MKIAILRSYNKTLDKCKKHLSKFQDTKSFCSKDQKPTRVFQDSDKHTVSTSLLAEDHLKPSREIQESQR